MAPVIFLGLLLVAHPVSADVIHAPDGGVLALPDGGTAEFPGGSDVVLPRGSTITFPGGEYEVVLLPPPPPPEPNAPPPVTGWSWVELTREGAEPSGSAMDSVHIPAVDEQWDYKGGAGRSWSAIQRAWSGGVVANGKLYVTGGGHADGAHNGVLAVDSDGKWSRVTEPGKIWRKTDCPVLPGNTRGTCTTEYGTCTLGWCTTGKDGQPVAIHSYNGLAADNNYLYRSGGAVWSHGNSGTGPKNFKLDFATGEWSTFPDCGRESTMSNLIHVDGKLYLITKDGRCVFDTATWRWEIRKGAYAVPGNSKLVYHKGLDRFYIFGNKWLAWVERSKFGTEWNKIANKPALITEKYLGVVEYGGIFFLWKTGVDVATFDPNTEEWGVITPSGDPGRGLGAGANGRFNVLDGQIVLVNGASNNMYKLVQGGGGTAPPVEPPTEPPVEPPPAPNEPPPPVEPPTQPGTGDLPQITLLDYPYYSEPQTDIVERTCGPLSEWEVRDITTNEQVEAQRGFRKGDRIIFNVHWKETIYPALSVKGVSCALIRGINGPGGEKPHMRNVNMTRSAKDRPTRQGGLKIENIYLSMYEAREHFGTVKSGDCVGVPNSSQFMIFDNVDMIGCRHHSFITSGAYGMYLEIANSNFKYAGSHLAYIDSVAMAYIHDSTFASPSADGHALRCIAGRCLIQNVHVSSIELDGTIRQKVSGGEFAGMHPLEVYNCGADHLVENVRIDFYRRKSKRSSTHASIFRNRDAKWGCNLSYHDDTQWYKQEYGTPEWVANQNWPERRLTYNNVEVNCLTEDDAEQARSCHAIMAWSSHPIAHDGYRGSLKTWLRAEDFQNEPDGSEDFVAGWQRMLDALPGATLRYPSDWYRWTVDQVLPGKRKAMLSGSYTNKWPVKPHPIWSNDLAVVELNNVTVTNSYKDTAGKDILVRPRGASDYYCWTGPDGPQCSDRQMPSARVQ